MDVRCERCQARYVVDDGLVDETGLAVRCSKCGHLFRVKRPGRGWTLRRPGSGEVAVGDTAALQRWIVEGRVSRQDELSRDGGPWVRAGEMKDLEPFLAVVDKARAGAENAPHRPARVIADDEPTLDMSEPTPDVWKGPPAGPQATAEPAWAATGTTEPSLADERGPERRDRRQRGSRLPWALAAIAVLVAGGTAIYLESPGWLGLERPSSNGAPNGTPRPAEAQAPQPPAEPAPSPPPSPAPAPAGARGEPPAAPAPAPTAGSQTPTPSGAAPGPASAPSPAAPPGAASAPTEAAPAQPSATGPAPEPQPVAPPPAAAAAQRPAGPDQEEAPRTPAEQPARAAAPTPPAPPRPTTAEAPSPSAPASGRPLATAPATPPRKEATQARGVRGYLADARRLRDRGRPEAALEMYARAVQVEPDNADALAGRGLCYLDLSQYVPAEESFKAALAANAENGAALMGLAETYRYEGRRAEAVTYYRKYLAAHPQGEDATAARNAISALEESQ